jgi:hypothetical protein
MPTGSPLRLTLCLLTWNELDGCRHDGPNRSTRSTNFAVDGGSTVGTVAYSEQAPAKRCCAVSRAS